MKRADWLRNELPDQSAGSETKAKKKKVDDGLFLDESEETLARRAMQADREWRANRTRVSIADPFGRSSIDVTPDEWRERYLRNMAGSNSQELQRVSQLEVPFEREPAPTMRERNATTAQMSLGEGLAWASSTVRQRGSLNTSRRL